MSDTLIIEDDDGSIEVTINTASAAVLEIETGSQQVLILNEGPPGPAGPQGPPGSGGGGSGESYEKLTTSKAILAADSHTVYTNEGASALVIVDIPASAEGLKFTFLVTDNTGGIKLDFAGSNIGRLGSAVTSAGGTLTGAKPGCSITIRGTDTAGYITESVVGVWKEA